MNQNELTPIQGAVSSFSFAQNENEKRDGEEKIHNSTREKKLYWPRKKELG